MATFQCSPSRFAAAAAAADTARDAGGGGDEENDADITAGVTHSVSVGRLTGCCSGGGGFRLACQSEFHDDAAELI